MELFLLVHFLNDTEANFNNKINTAVVLNHVQSD